MELASRDQELRAALFRFVDVVPACRSLDDVARHLTGFLDEVPDAPPPIAGRDADRPHQGRPRRARARRPPAASSTWRTASSSARHPRAALGVLGAPVAARGGQLGRPARRGHRDRGRRPTATPRAAPRRSRSSRARRRGGRARPVLERDVGGALPRANVSVKVSALTPLLRPDAPELRSRDAARAAASAAAPAPASSTPTSTSTWSRSTHARRCSSWCSSCSPRRSSARARRPESCCRPTCATRPSSSRRSSPGRGASSRTPPLHGPAGQGRLLGSRARAGAPARLAARRYSRSRPSATATSRR